MAAAKVLQKKKKKIDYIRLAIFAGNALNKIVFGSARQRRVETYDLT